MITTTNKEGICACGHEQRDHNPHIFPFHGIAVPGHGPCAKLGCDCKQFTWVAWRGTPEAKKVIQKAAERQALTAINKVARGFGY